MKRQKCRSDNRKHVLASAAVAFVVLAVIAAVAFLWVLPQQREKKYTDDREETGKGELGSEGESYIWTVEPQIAADEIYYLRETDSKTYSENEMNLQMTNTYAVIRRGDSYGLIGSDGQILGAVDYAKVWSLYGNYMLTGRKPVYSEDLMEETSDFCLYQDEIVPTEVSAGDAYGYKGAYYYCDGLYNICDAYPEGYFGPATWEKPADPVPVKKSDVNFKDVWNQDKSIDGSKWLEDLKGKYGIYSYDKMSTDFMFEACGSEACGLFAAEKNGKWGYIDSEGKVVIPIEYDASWTQYIPQNQDKASDFCYAASEGYVVLVKEGKWEMRNSKGDLVVDPGIFDQMLPMVNGKCWVKQNGKWGVIELVSHE